MAQEVFNDEIDQFESEDENAAWNEVVVNATDEAQTPVRVFQIENFMSFDSDALEASGLDGLGQTTHSVEPMPTKDEMSNNNEIPSSQEPIQRMAINDQKAGMEGLDKEKINKVIFEASRGSKFYENEKKKERRVKEKINNLRDSMRKFSDSDFKKARKEANKFIKIAKTERNFGPIIVHVDMDAFYAAVETRDNPSFKDVPMAVGSMSMLCTSNYAARKYGVRAAMPGFIAKKLCPSLTIVPSNFTKYRQVSNQVRNIIAEYDPNFSGVGLDEAYLDLTDFINDIYANHYHLTGSSQKDLDQESKDLNQESKEVQRQHLIEKTVQELREKIFLKTQLTASAGIACNVMLAKVCSDINKPNGQYFLPPTREAVMSFIKDLPIRKVSGIGRVSEQILNYFGITKCGDLYEKRELLYLLFSEISFQHFIRISLGISSTMVDNESERKSMSAETTFQDICDPEKLYQICKDLCDGLANDLEKEKLAVKSITVKFKLVNFEVKTRTKTIPDYVDTSIEIFDVAKKIIKSQINEYKPEKLKLRLLGIRVSELGKKQKVSQNRLDLFLSGARHSTTTGKEACNRIEENAKVSVSKEASNEVPGIVSKSDDTLDCPICQVAQKCNEINAHIDSCLNKQEIKKILSEDCKVVNKDDDYQKGKKRKGIIDVTNGKSAKKKTLLSFWGNS